MEGDAEKMVNVVIRDKAPRLLGLRGHPHLRMNGCTTLGGLWG